jgi:hypothetical protein
MDGPTQHDVMTSRVSLEHIMSFGRRSAGPTRAGSAR